MSCRARLGFVSHDLDFSQPTPMGFAQCRRCGAYVTLEQWAAWRCEEAGRAPLIPVATPDRLPCALCDAPVPVEPRHRAWLAIVGLTCDACYQVADLNAVPRTITAVWA